MCCCSILPALCRRFFFVPAFVVLAALLQAGCRSPVSVETPSSGSVRTDPKYLDPEIDPEFLEYLLDNSTSMPQGTRQKGDNRIEWLSDTADAMADYAESFVSADSATHIPYVWGGKQIDKPTEWSTPPLANNNGCSARIGLDCSGFVGLVLKHYGVRPDVAEVSVAGLIDITNWQKVKKTGHQVLYFAYPKAENLLPGDILIFMDKVGNLVHTGIFYSQKAKFPGGTQPGFINSVGHSKCADNYAKEARGKLTGVVLSPFGPKTQARTIFALRILAAPHIQFSFDGHNYVNTNDSIDFAGFTFDTITHDFQGSAYAYSSDRKKRTFLNLHAVGVTKKGTYDMPAIPYDSNNYSMFYTMDDSLSYADSLTFYATTPPDWWKGSNPPSTGGQMKIESFSLPNNYQLGTVAGTFSFKANAYWSRYEDSTYYQDTVKITTSVEKYYVRQQAVKGKFEGGMLLE